MYYKLTINSTSEIILALIADQFPLESIEEQESESIIYFEDSVLTESVKSDIHDFLKTNEVDGVWEAMQDQNWNEVWESNFQPVDVDDICRVRAEFHDTNPDVKYEIVIQPKMAFGTGHHQTTYMMLKDMFRLDFENKAVFDYGAGTGILAIFASMLKANHIDAVDIEEESYLNTIENAQRNNISNIKSIHGVLSDVPNIEYDVILANINRNILIDSCEGLSHRLKSGGLILLSGILEADEEIVTSRFEDEGFTLDKQQSREGWIQITMLKN
jgi:ribosomal protein L11 methyltransferase